MFAPSDRHRVLPCVAALCCLAVAAGVAGAPCAAQDRDPLLGLPVLAKPQPHAMPAPGQSTPMVPGLLIGPGPRVIMTGSVIIDQGPVDGMEVFACMRNGKTHESVLRLDVEQGKQIKAACIGVLGLDADGMWAPQNTGQPARGMPVRVTVQWQDPDKPGAWLEVDASCLVRDRLNDQPYPPLPFVYTGSRFMTIEDTDPAGKTVKREVFMLDNTKSVIDIYDESDALLASPFPGAGYCKHFEANSGICPPVGTPVRMQFTNATLPLTLAMGADGQLSLPPSDKPLDDAQLSALLAKDFAVGAAPSLYAVGITVLPLVDRAKDVAARLRILTLAAQAKVWVVPVFIAKIQPH